MPCGYAPGCVPNLTPSLFRAGAALDFFILTAQYRVWLSQQQEHVEWVGGQTDG